MYYFEIHVFLVPFYFFLPKKGPIYSSSPSAFPGCGHLLAKNEISLSLFPEMPPHFSLLLTITTQKSAALKQNFLQCVMLLLKFNDIQG